MKRLLFLALIFLSGTTVAQKTENLILITLDGLRWQELFTGAEAALMEDDRYCDNPEELKKLFWNDDPNERREKLMPFFWSTIASEGQLYGNRNLGNKVDCSNTQLFSYPGYNEILTGKADDERITSNDKINNANVTILEYLNGREPFKESVYAFGSWDVFPYIINEERSKVPVNAGFESSDVTGSSREHFLNQLQKEVRSPWATVRLDVFTHHFAMETLEKKRPRMLYIAYGETDDYAHDGAYDEYLKSARQTDEYIRNIWDYLQSDEHYRGKTTLVITTDHGRGTDPREQWTSHGSSVKGAEQIWLAVIGPEVSALGEVTKTDQHYQSQVAATVAALLGIDYDLPGAGKPIKDIIAR